MISENKAVILINSFNTTGDVHVHVSSLNDINDFSFDLLETNFHYQTKSDKNLDFDFHINSPILWDINSPYLYHYQMIVNKEKIEGTFGFRTLSHDKKNIFINNRPIFIKGYVRGAAAHEHQNNLNLEEVEFYRKNIKEAKKFGFNLIRFHSVVPNEALFTAADLEGILVHLELRQPNDNYNNLEEMLFSKKDLVPNSFVEYVINSFYNHPSLAIYCIGNEIKGLDENRRSEEIAHFIKDKDPNRLFVDSCAWGKFNRPNIDLDVQHLSYFFPFGKHSEMYSNPRTIHTLTEEDLKGLKEGESPYQVPLIAHEICHYTALRNFYDLKEKCLDNNVSLPWWIDEEIKLIKEKNYNKKTYLKMYRASKYFQYICWKEAFEKVRSSPLLGGFHFLQFADTDKYENSNGIVDFFDDENVVKPKSFLKFNDDFVLLTNLKKNYYSGDVIDIKLAASNYLKQINKSRIICYLKNENKKMTIHQQVVDSIPFGSSDISNFQIKLPKVQHGQKWQLVVNCIFDNNKYVNNWDLWLYPHYPKLKYRDLVNINEKEYVITDDIKTALESLRNKKKTVLIYRQNWTRHLLDKQMEPTKYAFKATWNRFKPVIWDRGTNFGGLINKELLNKYHFPTSQYYDFNYSVISEDADKIILDDFPIKVSSLVTGIDKCNRDRFDAYKVSFNLPELMPDRTLRNFSYLFEMKVDDTPLLVTGFNLTNIDEDEPSSLAFANFLFEYIKSNDFNPKNNIKYHELEDYMRLCAKKPIKERMMTQFWELDNEPVESKEYWTSSRQYLLEDEEK